VLKAWFIVGFAFATDSAQFAIHWLFFAPCPTSATQFIYFLPE